MKLKERCRKLQALRVRIRLIKANFNKRSNIIEGEIIRQPEKDQILCSTLGTEDLEVSLSKIPNP